MGKTPVCEEHYRQRMGIPAPPTTRLKDPPKQESEAMPKRIDEETKAAILRDHADGMNVNAIATKHSVGWLTAKKTISESGKPNAGGGSTSSSATKAAKRAASNGHFAVKLSAEGMDAVWSNLPAEKKAELLGHL